MTGAVARTNPAGHASAATTVYVTDADNRGVLDYDAATGAIKHWYAYGAGSNEVLNAVNVAAGTRATLIPDIQGSLIGALDSGGTLTKTAYQPFGENPALTTDGYRYTGQQLDAETAGSTAQPSGLYYYRARHYSPTWGRFLQPDPAASGTNLYAYANNDPLNGTDPSGLGVCTGISGEGFDCQTFNDLGLDDLDTSLPPVINITPPDSSGSTSGSDGLTVTGAGPDLGPGLSANGGGGVGNVSTPPVGTPANDPTSGRDGLTVTSPKKQAPIVVAPMVAIQVSMYSPEFGKILPPQTSHNYQFKVPTTCSAKDAFASIKGAGMSAPLAPQAREGLTKNVRLAGGNTIAQYVNSANMTIINTTNPGHIFYPGSVTIQVAPNGIGGSDISITGTGSGKDPLLNDVIGYAFFGGMANLVAANCAAANGAFQSS